MGIILIALLVVIGLYFYYYYYRSSVMSAKSTKINSSTANVEMLDNIGFLPRIMTISTGTTVTWINKGTMQHSATAYNGAFNSKILDPNQSYSFTFNTPGIFEYYCIPHATWMFGKITVTN